MCWEGRITTEGMHNAVYDQPLHLASAAAVRFTYFLTLYVYCDANKFPLSLSLTLRYHKQSLAYGYQHGSATKSNYDKTPLRQKPTTG